MQSMQSTLLDPIRDASECLSSNSQLEHSNYSSHIYAAGFYRKLLLIIAEYQMKHLCFSQMPRDLRKNVYYYLSISFSSTNLAHERAATSLTWPSAQFCDTFVTFSGLSQPFQVNCKQVCWYSVTFGRPS